LLFMTNSRRVCALVGAFAALVTSAAYPSTVWAQMTVYRYSDQPGKYDRFLNDPAFIGAGYNWSGVGRGINTTTNNLDVGSWGTMISSSYFITANHFNPTVVGANALRFYYTNSTSGGYEDHTYTTVGNIGGDLWLGKLDTPVGNNVAKYPIPSLPNYSSYGNLPLTIFGLSTPYPGTAAGVRLGTNNIDPQNALNGGPPVTSYLIGSTTGNTYTFNYSITSGAGEAKLELGDSGAPNFYTVNGMPTVIGINWYALMNGSGSTAVPTYISALQAAMIGEQPTIVTATGILGDFNLDGQLTQADVPAMLKALADLGGYKSLHGISQDYLLKIGDLNHDSVVTNADMQPLLAMLGGGGSGSGIVVVPEPASVVLLGLGGLAFALTVAQRRKNPARLHA
jgi:hypothetical protein